MFAPLYFFISFISLLIASYTDLKERIISNKLTYGIIVLGLGLHALEAFLLNDAMVFVYSAGICLLTFLFAYLLWKMGVWAGGDVKIFTGIAALNPFNFDYIGNLIGINSGIVSTVNYPIFPLSLFVFSIFAMLPYGAAMSIYGIAKRKELQGEFFSEVKKRSIQLVSASFLIVGLSRAFIFLNINLLLVIPVLLVFAFLPKKIEWTIAVPLFGYALYSGWENALFNFVGVYIPLFLIYFIIRLYLISRKYILKKTIKISELKEGDIPADTFVQDPQTGKIEVSEKLSIGSVINHLRNNTLKNALANKRQGWRVIADSMSAAGLENTQVDGLKNAAQEGKIKDEIEIKLSAPFVPAILIAYIVLQTIGDVFWIVLYHL